MAESDPKTGARSADKTPPKPDVFEAIVAHLAETKGVTQAEAREHLAKMGEPEKATPGTPTLDSLLHPEPKTVFYVLKDGGRNDVTGVSTRIWLGSSKSAYSDRDGQRTTVRTRVRLMIEAITDARERMFPAGAAVMRFDVAKSEGIRVTPECKAEYPEAELRDSEYPEAYTLRDAMRLFVRHPSIKSMLGAGEIQSEEDVRTLLSDQHQEFVDAIKRWEARGRRSVKPTIKPISRQQLGWAPNPLERSAIAAGRVTITANGETRNLSAIPVMG